MNWYNQKIIDLAIKRILKSDPFVASLLRYYEIISNCLDSGPRQVAPPVAQVIMAGFFDIMAMRTNPMLPPMA